MTIISGTTAIQAAPAEHWRREVEAINGDARKILLRVAEAKRIARANRIPDVVAALDAGAAVPGTTMSKEQAEAWMAMVVAVDAFLQQEIAPGVTIEDGLYAMWPVIESQHEAPA